MEYYKMNFRDFINPQRKQVQKQVEEPVEELEEYQDPVHKPVKRVPQQIEEEYDEPEYEQEYEYEDEEQEEYYEPPVRQVPRVQQKQQRQTRPIQQVPVRKPVKQQYRPGYAMPDAEFRRPLAVSQKQLRENTIEGTANSLTEAIKRKVDTVFYRFGIQGLEKLDEKILDTIEELQYPEPKPVKKTLKEMRRTPARKPVKKYRPLPLENVPPIPEPEPEYEEHLLPPEYSYQPQDVDVDEPLTQTVEYTYQQQDVQEPEVEEVEEIAPPPVIKKPMKASPKPSFMKPVEMPKPTPKVEESTGDEEEDLIRAAYNVDYTPDEEDKHEDGVSDDEMWNTVEAILEAKPSQELVHEPQGTSSLPAPPPSIEETESIEEEKQEETPVKESSKKRKRKTKTVEENTTNEEN